MLKPRLVTSLLARSACRPSSSNVRVCSFSSSSAGSSPSEGGSSESSSSTGDESPSDSLHSQDIAFKPAESGWGAGKQYQDNYDRIFGGKKKKKVGGGGGGGRWVYKDGERLAVEHGTIRDSKGRVVSNWDGNNLDPESVKRHRQQLKRAGFVNNQHAKGIF
jgi:hypothetical protein